MKASLYTNLREGQRQVTNFTMIVRTNSLCILALHLAAYSGYRLLQSNICFVRNANNYRNLFLISSLLCLIICSSLFNHEGRADYVFIPKKTLIFAFNIFVLMFGILILPFILFTKIKTRQVKMGQDSRVLQEPLHQGL